MEKDLREGDIECEGRGKTTTSCFTRSIADRDRKSNNDYGHFMQYDMDLVKANNVFSLSKGDIHLEIIQTSSLPYD